MNKKQKQKEIKARIKKRLSDALKGKSKLDKYSKFISEAIVLEEKK